ncbi:hypothetical protein [Mucilaginibacter myungsuensis]|uniref:Uncharacterized protein n=1 Tax=Mucilaginibacter myungsuensis TaxID=649104 RepID=A0A929PXA7_9SPHI|nr:hypothetical protein [Mucilaginibacter myungsuensis]MBE9663663.1 hypothetical protein [Mucilaginibacter myungsuensis]MDN3599013.1 hypothetical protein [Mucilaginibacter myungsuensis]
MKDFDHIMTLWQEQPVHNKLSVDEVLKQVKRDVSGLANKLRWNIITIVSLIIFTAVVLLFFVFTVPTYIGISIMMATMLFYFATINRHYRMLSKHDATMSPTDYLDTLHEYQQQQSKTAGWFYYIYVLMISLGLSLFLYEVLSTYSIYGKLVVYATMAGWLLFCTFYLKRRIFKHEQEKLNVMIDRLERLKSQFE